MKVDARIAVLVIALSATPAWAAEKNVSPLQAYSGQLPLDVLPPMQSSIASASALQRVWTVCKVKGEPPKVDFARRLVLLAVRRGSVVRFMNVKLVDGNLTTNVVVTPDMPGYQTCAMVVIDRAGVQKVNGAPVGQ